MTLNNIVNNLRKRAVGVGLTTVVLSLAGCGATSQKSCENDFDCPGQQTCENNVCSGAGQKCSNDFDCPGDEYCANNLCTSNGQQSCNNDFDCPGDSVCENNVCSGYGSAQPPQERYDEFVSILSSNDLEQSLSYFDPLMQNKYKTILQNEDLKKLSGQLKGATLTPTTEGERLREYTLVKSCNTDIECPGEQTCENGQCDGIEYSILFMKTYQNGTETWSIRGL
ncbi:hypothetical protein HZC30_08135 [Candidatus Woesearchaeota archaeon]|nr:hypothetical protein [Candidatus Woesearchaeota archaeon]